MKREAWMTQVDWLDNEHVMYRITGSRGADIWGLLWVPEILAHRFRKFWPVDEPPQT
jgi:hypothetical protein